MNICPVCQKCFLIKVSIAKESCFGCGYMSFIFNDEVSRTIACEKCKKDILVEDKKALDFLNSINSFTANADYSLVCHDCLDDVLAEWNKMAIHSNFAYQTAQKTNLPAFNPEEVTINEFQRFMIKELFREEGY